MGLSFLPEDVKNAVEHLNVNFLTEIRLRRGRPVIVEYRGKYGYLSPLGITSDAKSAVIAGDISAVIGAATGGCVFGYTEQMKSGFITVEHGVRIGIAGEYVTENGKVTTIKAVTSLNIRIPHEVYGCGGYVCKTLYAERPRSTLIFSKPGLGKTTMLRDIARNLSSACGLNVLIFDERGEIAAMDGYGEGFDLGNADIVRAYSKFGAIASAIRAMKPDVIITDELYGEDDLNAARYAADCGIAVIASSHVTDRLKLSAMPFEYFVQLTAVGALPLIYDKNFNSFGNRCADNVDRRAAFGK